MKFLEKIKRNSLGLLFLGLIGLVVGTKSVWAADYEINNFESEITSILIQFPQPIAFANLAILTASSAFLAPEVLGSKITPSGIFANMSSSS